MAQVFSCEFYEISKNTFFKEHLRETASNSWRCYTISWHNDNRLMVLLSSRTFMKIVYFYHIVFCGFCHWNSLVCQSMIIKCYKHWSFNKISFPLILNLDKQLIFSEKSRVSLSVSHHFLLWQYRWQTSTIISLQLLLVSSIQLESDFFHPKRWK